MLLNYMKEAAGRAIHNKNKRYFKDNYCMFTIAMFYAHNLHMRHLRD